MNIRKCRLKAGITQKELALRMGMKSVSCVCMWESGERSPSSNLVPDIARALGCSISDLYDTVRGEDEQGD